MIIAVIHNMCSFFQCKSTQTFPLHINWLLMWKTHFHVVTVFSKLTLSFFEKVIIKMHWYSACFVTISISVAAVANTHSLQIQTAHLQRVLLCDMTTDFPLCKNTCLFCWFCRVTLTCTHSFFVPRLVRAVVTVQSLVVVAGVSLVAHLAHLPGTGLAAVTAIHEEAHTWWTSRGDLGTLARPFAVLCPVVKVRERRGDGRWHGSGILGVGLERSWQIKSVMKLT